MRVAICNGLLVLAFASYASSQAPRRQVPEPPVSFATNECLQKGGVGIVRPSLYIYLRTERNQLLLADGKKWTGKKTEQPEIVIVFHGQVWRQVPEDFDLAAATVLSFEKDRVRFFDFNQMEGGFYRKHPSHH
jgi:hypothetical protein